MDTYSNAGQQVSACLKYFPVASIDADQLIPPAAAKKLQGLRTEQEQNAAATALGIAAGIVVWRMPHKGGYRESISMA